MANFDLIEYQKRVIRDLTADVKALKEALKGDCKSCRYIAQPMKMYHCCKCSSLDQKRKVNYWEWKGVDEK